jgi:serine/threonine-protein kinase
VSKAELLKAFASTGLQALTKEPIVSMPFEPGEIICGKYQIIELIGSGGMGFVVSASHVELREKVALKFLRPEALTNEDLVARFAREARAAVSIKSEYVARVFDIGNLPDAGPFIVMEYLEGRDLWDVVREQGPLPIKMAVEFVMQACEALATAHAAGIVHRDVKPENLFLTERAQGMASIKVLDFGISKVALTGSAFEADAPLVQTMMPMGSPVYMSPEQIRASQDVDARTDIWSLGCVLYELLTGTAAFDAPSVTQLSAVILEQHPLPLRSYCPDAPAELEAVITRCLEKDPKKRFQDVGELALALLPFAPRRARISAERCCYVLKKGRNSEIEIDPASIPPPPMPDFGTFASLAADKREGDEAVPNSTSKPASITLPQDEPPDFRPSNGSKRILLVGLAVAAVASIWAISARRHSAVTAAAAPDTVVHTAEGTPPAVDPWRPVVVNPAVAVDPNETAVAPGSTPPVATKSNAVPPGATAKIKLALPPAPKPKAAPTTATSPQAAPGKSEPDPGF